MPDTYPENQQTRIKNAVAACRSTRGNFYTKTTNRSIPERQNQNQLEKSAAQLKAVAKKRDFYIDKDTKSTV